MADEQGRLDREQTLALPDDEFRDRWEAMGREERQRLGADGYGRIIAIKQSNSKSVPEQRETPVLAPVLELPRSDLSHSDEAEQSVLGGLMLDNRAWDRVRDVVTESDFYRADHRLIFQHIRDLIARGEPVDEVTVPESLERAGKLAEAGGRAYLGSLEANTPSAANIKRYAEIVRERARRREVAGIANELADNVLAFGTDVDELLRNVQAAMATIRPISQRRGALDWRAIAASPPPSREWAC